MFRYSSQANRLEQLTEFVAKTMRSYWTNNFDVSAGAYVWVGNHIFFFRNLKEFILWCTVQVINRFQPHTPYKTATKTFKTKVTLRYSMSTQTQGFIFPTLPYFSYIFVPLCLTSIRMVRHLRLLSGTVLYHRCVPWCPTSIRMVRHLMLLSGTVLYHWCDPWCLTSIRMVRHLRLLSGTCAISPMCP